MPDSTDLSTLPDRIETEAQLDEVMTRPGAKLVETMRGLRGPLVVLGAGGKMGPTLAVLARRAADAAGRKDFQVIAVSRFTNPAARDLLEKQGVQILAMDLMDRSMLNRLPDAENIIYMVGLKFGTSGKPAMTWAMNTLAPAHVCERYPQARIAALSSGNVYPLSPVWGGGARETDALTPLGEYANSVVARERIFDFFSDTLGTRVAHIRLTYALDLRYGVLVDIARKVLRSEPVDLTMGYFNAIWQADANDAILRALDLASCPAQPLNLTCQEIRSVRECAERLGEYIGKSPVFTGRESDTALINATSLLYAALGEPPTDFQTILRWTADWIQHERPTLNKPTHFEVRDGKY